MTNQQSVEGKELLLKLMYMYGYNNQCDFLKELHLASRRMLDNHLPGEYGNDGKLLDFLSQQIAANSSVPAAKG